MAEQTHNRDMSDEPDRQDLEDRVDQLESTISKMLPSRRDALKLGGAALVGGAAMSGAASAQAGDQDGEAGVIGTDNAPVDIEASDIEVDDLVVNNTATGVAQDLQGCRVSLSSDQTIAQGDIPKIGFDSIGYDSDNNFDTSNAEWTCPKDGLYFAKLQVQFLGGGDGEDRRTFIGDEITHRGSGEGAAMADLNSFSDSRYTISTMSEYQSGDKIASYAFNRDSNDILQSGGSFERTHLEVAFIGSL